jgi:Ca-activated chloride channel family protein
MDGSRRWVSQVAAVVVGVLLILYLRGTFADDDGGAAPTPAGPRKGCVGLRVTASSEKAALLSQISDEYERTDPRVGGKCVDVVVTSKSSGGTMDALARGWDETVDGPRPDVWSPAGSVWVVLLEQRLADRDAPNLVPDGDIPTIAQTPLVIAMPRPMAQALGWPSEQIGWRDLFALANDPRGWGALGHPEWGAFELGKTNPNFSTSGLNALVGTYFAATGVSSDLTLDRVRDPATEGFVRGVERSVVHYGDITLTFLENLQRADDRGEGLTYISAVTVEEKSVWDYNQGNPTGDPATLGDHPKPSVPLVAIYPEEGTPVSDNPFVVLEAPWVDDAKREAAAGFLAFVQRDEQQARFQEFAFRSFDGTPGPTITRENGLLPEQPALVLDPPAPEVLDEIQRGWTDLRKRARVLLVIDISGSMGEAVPEAGASKLDLAKEAAVDALDLFAPDDEVGLWVFTTDLPDGDTAELIPIGPVGPRLSDLRRAIRSLQPLNGTPLYTATEGAVTHLRSNLDPERINGVVLLTDGRNEDPRNTDLGGLLRFLDSELTVRVFPIAYGADADLETLRRIAEASRAQVYDATDPAAIAKVFVSVISNF